MAGQTQKTTSINTRKLKNSKSKEEHNRKPKVSTKKAIQQLALSNN